MGGLVGFSNPDHQEQLILFCTILSYSVLILTAWYKAPQVYAVVHSGSSLGISLVSLLLEFTSYSIEMTYQVAMEYPLVTYFDIILMWFQDIILVYTVLENRHLITPGIIPHLIIYIVAFTLIITRRLPDIVMYLFIGSTTVILTTSKSIQLWKVVDTENPGSLSALTWILLSYMAMARIVTSAVMTGDIMMLMNTTFATILDVAVATAIIYYNHLKEKRTQWRRSHNDGHYTTRR